MKLAALTSASAIDKLASAAAQAEERQVIDVGVSYSYVRYSPATTGFNSHSMNGRSGSVAVNFNSWLSGQKPAVLKESKSRVRYLAENQRNPFLARARSQPFLLLRFR